jgi:hypothetical protein
VAGHHDLSTDGPERTIAAVVGNIHGSCNPLNLKPSGHYMYHQF